MENSEVDVMHREGEQHARHLEQEGGVHTRQIAYET